MKKGLEDWVAHFSKNEFIDSFLNKRRLVIRSLQRECASSLLSWSEINRLIETGAVPSSNIRVSLNGKTFPEFMYRRAQDGLLRPDALQHLAAQGASLVINGIANYCPPIAVIADSIERSLAHKVSVNCYITFGVISAFKPHYDTHDVLAMQLHGAKRWRGYGTPIPFPMVEYHQNDNVDFGPPRWDELLEEGDLLYVPHGEVHDARCEVKPSVHLTFGILASNGIDFLNWIVKKAQDNPVFRSDIPRTGGDEPLRSYRDLLTEQMLDLLNEVSLVEFLNEIDQNRQSRVRLNFGLAGAIKMETWIAPTPRRRLGLALETKEDADVTIGGNVIRLSFVARVALDRLLEEDGLYFGDLTRKLETVAGERQLQNAILEMAGKGLVTVNQ